MKMLNFQAYLVRVFFLWVAGCFFIFIKSSESFALGRFCQRQTQNVHDSKQWVSAPIASLWAAAVRPRSLRRFDQDVYRSWLEVYSKSVRHEGVVDIIPETLEQKSALMTALLRERVGDDLIETQFDLSLDFRNLHPRIRNRLVKTLMGMKIENTADGIPQFREIQLTRFFDEWAAAAHARYVPKSNGDLGEDYSHILAQYTEEALRIHGPIRLAQDLGIVRDEGGKRSLSQKIYENPILINYLVTAIANIPMYWTGFPTGLPVHSRLRNRLVRDSRLKDILIKDGLDAALEYVSTNYNGGSGNRASIDRVKNALVDSYNLVMKYYLIYFFWSEYGEEAEELLKRLGIVLYYKIQGKEPPAHKVEVGAEESEEFMGGVADATRVTEENRFDEVAELRKMQESYEPGSKYYEMLQEDIDMVLEERRLAAQRAAERAAAGVSEQIPLFPNTPSDSP